MKEVQRNGCQIVKISPTGSGWYGFLMSLMGAKKEVVMRDRDPNRRERMAKAAEQQKVISKDELEKRIDNINKEKDDNAQVRKQEEFDRQRQRDSDEDRFSR